MQLEDGEPTEWRQRDQAHFKLTHLTGFLNLLNLLIPSTLDNCAVMVIVN